MMHYEHRAWAGTGVGDDRRTVVPEPLVLPAGAASARAARRWASEHVTAMGRSELVDVVTLLVSEVVTNAVLHAGSTVRVMVRPFRRDGIRVDVWDASGVAPRRPRGYSPTATTGRGTMLLDVLASSWGSVPAADGGKVTWFLVEPPSSNTDEAPASASVSGPAVVPPAAALHVGRSDA